MSRVTLENWTRDMAAARKSNGAPRGVTAVALFFLGIAMFANWAMLPSISAWSVSEWFINYAGGFVRRGLSGEVVLAMVSGAAGLEIMLNVFKSLAFFSLVGVLWSAWRLSKVLEARELFTLLCLPTPLPMLVVANGSYHRKEFLTILLLLLIIAIKPNESAGRRRLAIAIYACASVPLVLIHEGFLFWGVVPSICIITSGLKHSREIRAWGWACLLAPVVVGVALFAVHGSPNQAELIWLSVPADIRAILSPPFGEGAVGGISAIGWSLVDGLRLPLSVLTSPIVLLWVFVLGLCFLYLIGAGLRILERLNAENSQSWIDWSLLIIAASLPLYALGWDFGRWALVTSCALIVTLFSAAHSNLMPLRFAKIQELLAPLSATVIGLSIALFPAPRKWPATILWVLVLAFGRVPECCIAPVDLASGLVPSTFEIVGQAVSWK